MCLTIEKDQSPLIAEEDIVCYKSVYLRDGYLYTLFQQSYVKIGQTYHSELEVYNNTVETGLHSNISLYDTNILTTSFDFLFSFQVAIMVKCIIPKESIYYKGIFEFRGFLFESYASDTLTYVEILK